METKEKVIAKYFESDHQNTFNHLSRLNGKIAHFGEKYEVFEKEAGMPPLDADLLKEVIIDGRQAIERAIDKVVATQPKPLQKTFRDSQYLELSKLDPAIREFSYWRDSISGIMRFPYELREIKNLPWKGLKLELDQNYFDSIKGHFEMVLESPVDLGLWERYEALRQAYNEFFAFAKANKRLVPNGFDGLFGIHPAFPMTEVKAYPESFLPSKSIHWRP